MAPDKKLSLRTRARQPRVNDSQILEAARSVFLADPDAPMSEVSETAKVGMSALYLRYKGKEDLLQEICRIGLTRYIRDIRTALADEADVWLAFSQFMHRIVEADTHALVVRLAGTFTPSKQLYREATKSQALTTQLFDRLKVAKAIRPDAVVTDIAFIFEQLASVKVADAQRTSRLRKRYLAMYLDALTCTHSQSLPGPEPRWNDVNARWNRIVS